MAARDYYELLEIAPSATNDEIKHAFRQKIARYHPDKVQHLGKEFQDMAADRAAELTEAYRILTDAGRREEYDQSRGAAVETPPSPQPPPPPPAPEPPPAARRDTPDVQPPIDRTFTTERATRDEFVRQAAITHLRQAVRAADASYDECTVRGFDLAWVTKPRLFGRKSGLRLGARYVGQVDRPSVAESMVQAARWSGASGDEVCVFLMGTGLAPTGELAAEIAEQRRKQRSGRLILIPVDVRVWDARVPVDAPDVAKTVLAKLKAAGR